MVDFGNIASGALSGGAAGSTFGPFGTAIGAVGGGILGLFGKKKKKKKLSTFDDEQQRLYGDYVKGLRGQGEFSDLYNFDAGQANDVFDKTVANPAYRNYQENIIPGITGNFRGKNLQNSSYLGQSLARTGRDVQEGLDAQRSKYIFEGQQNAQNRKGNAINSVLGMNTFDYDNTTGGNKNIIDQVLEAAGPQAGQWFANYLKQSNNKSTISGSVPAR